MREGKTQKQLRICQENITITLSLGAQHGVCHVGYIILQWSSHHKKLGGEALLINYSVEQLKNQLYPLFSNQSAANEGLVLSIHLEAIVKIS